MFLSTVFRETLATVAGCPIQLYDTDGAVGAARGAGIGAGIFASPEEAFRDLTVLDTTEPMPSKGIEEAYQAWKTALQKQLQS